MFEGMLHAVLRTMRELARLGKAQVPSAVADGLEVYPISPARVMQFWDEGKSKSSLEETDGSGKKANSQNQRGVKRIKMDIVGDILSASTIPNSRNKRLACWDVEVHTAGKEQQSGLGVTDVVDAYLRRWNPQPSISQESKSKSSKNKSDCTSKQVYKIDKMDDLADCLLQGLTWLEWQARRTRLVRGDISVA